MCKISVIIPTYKRSNYICDAIDSVLRQTFENVEIIVVDDNGIGTESQIQNEMKLQKYIDSKKIKYIAHEINKNGAVARNTGIRESTGDYIAFLDDDDYFEQDKLLRQYNMIINKIADICLCGFTRVYTNKEEKTVPDLNMINIPNILMHRVDTCAGSSLLVKTELVKSIQGFDETFERQQDLEFLIRLLEKGNATIVEDSLVNIRMHEQNLRIPNLEKTVRQRLHFIDSFKDTISQYPQDVSDEIYDVQFTEIAKIAIKNHKFIEAIKWVYKTSHPMKTGLLILRSTKQYLDRRTTK